MKNDVIICTNLSKQYQIDNQNIAVLNNFSYEFTQGKSYALTGPSGSGKSTLIHLLIGVESSTTGAVVHSCPQKKYGVMLQTPLLINELSVLENIALPGMVSGFDMESCLKRARELIQQVGLETHAHQSPWQLSGGQQQRIALARALFFSPTFLIADEPTAHLDQKNAHEIITLLLSLADRQSMGLIIATHDIQLMSRLTHVISVN